MPRFLIQLTHSDEHAACVKALRAIEQYGSHFVTQANWGCKAGIHSGWLIAELPSRNEAMLMVPPEFRDEARIVELNQFTPQDIAALISKLEE
jgi:hypothetical protein